MRFRYHAIVDKLFDAAYDLSVRLPHRSRSGALAALNHAHRPEDYSLEGKREHPSGAGAAIFITARFRSGSTYLWTLLHQLGRFTVYYEPLHERRWFEDGARDIPIDPSHIGMTSYHTNYQGLEPLTNLYRERWTDRRLYMGAGATDRKLRAYIQTLIDHAAHQPVLQFNRVDFRLAWLRKQFPGVRLLHLYRSPREQWMSSLKGASLPAAITLADFKPYDLFYLVPWWRDLRRVFAGLRPCRTAHPYYAFYLLWRLSYLMGRHYADVSISYEQLAQSPQQVMGESLAAIGLPVDGLDWSRIEGMTDYRAEPRWPAFASAAWFEEVEGVCDDAVSKMLHG
jgi:hypothetical protein